MRFTLEIDPLDLDQTLGCGQTFRWRRLPDGSWTGVLSDQLMTVRRCGSELHAEAIPGGAGARDLLAEHLRAGDDIGRIQRRLSSDPVLRRGMDGLRGLRIVKLDEWECTVSFVLATYANIPRISKMIESLAAAYGKRIAPGTHAFPTVGRLRRASPGDLRRLGLGYRADYIHGVCAALGEDDLGRMKGMGFEELRAGLMELPGIGDKVADCASLFGFGRLEAFPIDVWMERALERLYRQKGSHARLRRFASERFGAYAGYAQEYLYYNERVLASDGACALSEK
jgi:N-glycosylase/DNA lyase